jgi:hypothetical protein
VAFATQFDAAPARRDGFGRGHGVFGRPTGPGGWVRGVELHPLSIKFRPNVAADPRGQPADSNTASCGGACREAVAADDATAGMESGAASLQLPTEAPATKRSNESSTRRYTSKLPIAGDHPDKNAAQNEMWNNHAA